MNKRKAIVLGVTGGIACGKSETGRILGETGFSVCDADAVAHGLMKQGTPVYKEIVGHFGKGILESSGEISRSVLGEIVFTQPGKRETLNRMVHPAVRECLMRWISEKRLADKDAAVLIPLLFESGMQDLDFDAVWCISSSEEEMYCRLAQRGMSREDAEQRILSQMPTAEKEPLADVVIPNNGTLGELEMAVRKAVEAMRG